MSQICEDKDGLFVWQRGHENAVFLDALMKNRHVAEVIANNFRRFKSETCAEIEDKNWESN